MHGNNSPRVVVLCELTCKIIMVAVLEGTLEQRSGVINVDIVSEKKKKIGVINIIIIIDSMI